MTISHEMDFSLAIDKGNRWKPYQLTNDKEVSCFEAQSGLQLAGADVTSKN
jgi:hypothetical protein